MAVIQSSESFAPGMVSGQLFALDVDGEGGTTFNFLLL